MLGLRGYFSKLFDHPERNTPLLIGAVGVLVIIISLLAIPPVWEYSNSPSFCGKVCHTMPPEFSTYEVSPHAREIGRAHV